MSAADLALVVHASRSHRRSSQLMPTSGPGRCRVTALSLSIRLRTERGLAVTEPQVMMWLEHLAALGCVDRGEGGWAVTDWDELGEVAAASEMVVARPRKVKR